jgi:hypothetical protein
LKSVYFGLVQRASHHLVVGLFGLPDRRFDMSLPHIQEDTLLAVIEKAMQNEPTHYCGKFLEKNPETAENLSSFAIELARSWFGAEDEGDILAQSTLLSSVMFMTYEMVKAEVEAKDLEDLIG